MTNKKLCMKIGIAIIKVLHYYVVFATSIYQVNLPPIARASRSPPHPAVLLALPGSLPSFLPGHYAPPPISQPSHPPTQQHSSWGRTESSTIHYCVPENSVVTLADRLMVKAFN